LSADLLFVAGAALLGLLVGSFLNVVVHRLPKMLEAEWRAQCAELDGRELPPAPRYDLWLPRSACPSCHTPLRERDNLPLLSYALLRGRCAFCKARISPRYPIIEALAGGLAAWVALRYGWGWQGALALVLVWTLIAAAAIDLDTTLLPDDLTLPLLWLGLVANLWGLYVPLSEAVLGAVAGYLSLWSVYWLFKLATGKEGMGYGDFKLLAALGAWLGWKLLLPIVLIASVVGALVGIGLIAARRHAREVPIPFGPYLATAGFLALVFRRELAGWLPF
jgi:leader peptidase (prepilin peptidase)/N-methyltransferase